MPALAVAPRQPSSLTQNSGIDEQQAPAAAPMMAYSDSRPLQHATLGSLTAMLLAASVLQVRICRLRLGCDQHIRCPTADPEPVCPELMPKMPEICGIIGSPTILSIFSNNAVQSGAMQRMIVLPVVRSPIVDEGTCSRPL